MNFFQKKTITVTFLRNKTHCQKLKHIAFTNKMKIYFQLKIDITERTFM